MSLAKGSRQTHRRIILTAFCLAVAAGGALRALRTEAVSALLRLEPVGQIGGYTQAVDVEGGYAYISEGPNLTILDVSQPEAPVGVGSLFVGELVSGIAATSDYAYLITESKLFLAIDVRDPGAPQLAGECNLPNEGVSVSLTGDFAYVAGRWGDVYIVNVHQPGRPFLINVYETEDWSYGLHIAGDRAYLANGNGGFQILDIADPIHPVHLATYANYNLFPTGIDIVGDFAYVAGLHSMSVFNVSVPTSPTLLGQAEFPFAKRIEVIGTTAYVQGGIIVRTVDVSNPSSPTETGLYAMPDIGEDFCVVDGFAYVADWSSLQILDVRGGGPAMVFGRYEMLGDARAVAMSGETAVVSNMNAGLRLFDTSSPAAPLHRGSTDIRAVSPRNVTVDGTLAYLAGHSDGIFIFDIADPTSPVLQSTYDNGNYAEGIRIAGGLAYVANAHDLLILDVSDPTSPAAVSSFPVPGWAHGIDLANEIAYVADVTSGLLVIDVADPRSPVLRSHYPTPSQDARAVWVDLPLAYLAAGEDGLMIFDVSDPSSPTLRGVRDTPGLAWGVCVDDGQAYIADLFSVLVVDVGDPAAPFLRAQFETPGGPESVCAADGLIYVADYNGGLWILNPANLAGTRAEWKAYF